MTTTRFLFALLLALAACGGSTGTSDGGGTDAGSDPCTPRTFHVTSDGASYEFDGSAPDPTLTLCRGVTYTFDLGALSSFHPMAIKSGGPAGTMLAMLTPGMTTTFTVPTAAPLPDTYVCMVHGFNGAITVP